jgi:hypothetical protein
MKLKVISIVFVSFLAATVTHADMRRGKFKGEAELATAVAQPTETVVKGIAWHCEGTRCSASADDWPGLDNFTKQCRTVAKELGQLTKFRSGGRIATKAELSNCNAAANLARKQNAGSEALAKQ